MCECGCSMGGPDYKFAGPKGVWYGIRIYSGCRECDAPVGVDVFRIEKGDEFGWLEAAEPLEFHKEAGTASIPVLRARELIKNMIAQGIEIDMDAYNEGDIIHMMTSAVSETNAAWRKAVESGKVF